MDVSLNYGALVAYLLVLVRAVAWLMVVPPFSNRQTIPPLATMAIASGMAVLIGPTLPASAIPTTYQGLIGAVIVDVITGVAIGYVVNLLLSAITSAGGMVDLAGGLNLPSALDPLSLDQTPMLGQFYQQVAVLLLFVSDGYLLMIEGFARSFHAEAFSIASSRVMALTMIADFTTFFTSALEIAAPILVVLFATQVVLALLAKAAPQMNVFLLGMPMQIFLSLTLVAISLSVIPSYLGNLLTRALGDASMLFSGT